MRPVLVVLLLLGLVACGDDGDDGEQAEAGTTASSTASSSTTDTSEATTTTLAGETESFVGVPTLGPAESPGFPATTSPPVYLQEVRAAAQQGFDRVVFELTGPVPAYRVEYVETPTAEGSGEPLAVAGEAFLQVTLTPASGVDLTGGEPVDVYTGPDRIEPSDTSLVEEVVRSGDFEATLTWVVGLGRAVDFGVAVIEDPGRLVIDLLAPEEG